MEPFQGSCSDPFGIFPDEAGAREARGTEVVAIGVVLSTIRLRGRRERDRLAAKVRAAGAEVAMMQGAAQ